MRALKLLVVVMGVLLVGGTVLLIVAIIDRASHRVAAPPVAARGFDRSVVELPAGSRILETELREGRVVVRVALAEGGEELILIDAASGARLGTLELRPASDAAR